MIDEKELLKALVCRANDPIVDCAKCPYYADSFAGSCDYQRICRDALALLREQEPRVLTEEELKRIEPYSVYWGEGLNVRNLWPMAFTDEAIKNIDGEYLKDSYGRAYELDLYNKDVMGWRIWTARPTEEQRKAVLWDET